jgi:curved DNA-binding protein CbpA
MAPCQVTDDYYEILGVQQSAGKDAIRASYKRLALLHHPDRNPNNPKATAQFQLVSHLNAKPLRFFAKGL